MQTSLNRFTKLLEKQTQQSFESYADLHAFSIEHMATFWQTLAGFYNIEFERQPQQIMIRGEHLTETIWFQGATLSYCKQVFSHFDKEGDALIYGHENGFYQTISWPQLLAKTLSYQSHFKALGVEKGDRVGAYVLNRPDTVAAFLAANSLGAIWASCPPEFGYSAVFDRFETIKPKVLIAHKSYTYRGKHYDKSEEIEHLAASLTGLENVVYLDDKHDFNEEHFDVASLSPLSVEFNHPIYILFSSGTTGKPKAITHGTGAMILEHCKALGLHQDVQKAERYFWYSTTGWMMYNYSLSALLLGATLCIYEGDSFFPDPDELWNFTAKATINHFGHGSVYYQKLLENIPDHCNASKQPWIKTIAATGSVLYPEVAENLQRIFPKAHIISLSGGTDVCSAFLGGLPGEPSTPGELQCKLLGAAVAIFDEGGRPVIESAGELVITAPLISMPLYFWGDPGKKRYLESYFERFDGVWTHGDWAKQTTKGSFILYGRSDATLNRHGIRIGTSELYTALKKLGGVEDSLVIHLSDQKRDELLLFVQKSSSQASTLTSSQINNHLKQHLSPRHMADHIYFVTDLPYTLSGKKLEIPIRKILQGAPIDTVVSIDSLRNPKALDYFKNLTLHYEK